MTSLITPAYRLPEGAHVGTVHVFGLAMMANSEHFAPVRCVSGVILRSILLPKADRGEGGFERSTERRPG